MTIRNIDKAGCEDYNYQYVAYIDKENIEWKDNIIMYSLYRNVSFTKVVHERLGLGNGSPD